MSNFNQKPVTAETRALVHKVVDRLLDYNPTETTQKATGNKPTFFVDIFGSTPSLIVRTSPNGFAPGAEYADIGSVTLTESKYRTTGEIYSELVSVLKSMDEFYNKWQEQKGNKNEDKQN